MLFGKKSNRYLMQRKRLLAKAKVWRKSPIYNRLVGDADIRMKRKTLKTAPSILIATWLDELHDQQRKIKKGQKANIIVRYTNSEDLREADDRFKQKITAGRNITL